jgi:hypothetical protein
MLALAGCGGPFLGVNVFVVGERTSLEKQVLGNYRALSSDFESFGSVRGVDEFGRVKEPPKITDSKQASIRAMQNRAYNRDDVDSFLIEGLAGEDNRGRLTLFEEALGKAAPQRQTFVRSVVDEENRDRETLIQRLMRTTPGVTPQDEGRVRALFASLNRDTAPEGSPIQLEDGTWSVK